MWWLYGLVFFSQFKPSEPFLVGFLMHVTRQLVLAEFCLDFVHVEDIVIDFYCSNCHEV